MIRKLLLILTIILLLTAFISICYIERRYIDLAVGNIRCITRTATPEQRYYVNNCNDLAFRSATFDAYRSILLGDYHLVGVAGFGLFHPGIPDEIDRSGNITYDHDRMVVGMGDCSMCYYDDLYQSFSYHYAKKYNSIMWPFFKKHIYTKAT